VIIFRSIKAIIWSYSRYPLVSFCLEKKRDKKDTAVIGARAVAVLIIFSSN